MNTKEATQLFQREIEAAYGDKNTFFIALDFLGQVIHRDTEWILTNQQILLSAKQKTAIETYLERIRKREPIQYIIGFAEFYNSRFEVNSAVLIPRPETEGLVEQAINWLKKNQSNFNNLQILDIGTGSGCIIISIAKELSDLPNIEYTATDISAKALNVAKRNAETILGKNHGIKFVKADLFPKSSEKFHLICSNPPYISESDYEKLPPHIKNFEPKHALLGGKDGQEIVKRIKKKLSTKLHHKGVAFIETESLLVSL